MIRLLTGATILAAAITLPVIAQDTTGDSAAPPPAAMSDQEAPVVKIGQEAPDMTMDQETPDVTMEQEAGMMLTAEEAKSWIDKPVHSDDGTKVGKIAEFARGADDEVTEMHVDMGGFLGLGQTRIRLTPAQFMLQDNRATLNLTAKQAKDLPKVQR